MFFNRLILPDLEQALKSFPVVLLTGPRQTGKTELLKHSFPYSYFTLDALDVRAQAVRDPRSFFVSEEKKLIIDEIQEAPELLSYVKEFVDAHREARVILTGSHQFHLMKGVSESLAGRVAIFNLLPFSWKEIQASPFIDATSPTLLGELLLKGLYPAVQTTPDLNLDLWFSSYVNTYIERDLRQQVAIRDLRSFEHLLQLLASRIGQELNVHSLGKELGLTDVTLKTWISALEAAFIIHLLPPYYQNFGKRVVKTPKLYFYDTGLVCYLTRIKTGEQALAGPLAGPLFENFVINEKIKERVFAGQKPSLYFWRSHDGLEVDLIEEEGLSLSAYEIKLSHTITESHGSNLKRFAHYAKKPVERMTLISQSLKPALPPPLLHEHWQEVGKK